MGEAAAAQRRSTRQVRAYEAPIAHDGRRRAERACEQYHDILAPRGWSPLNNSALKKELHLVSACCTLTTDVQKHHSREKGGQAKTNLKTRSKAKAKVKQSMKKKK